jgi:predicted polyphosphate/ATP-dependent NAD kinase
MEHTIGLVINPIAGMGGTVGLKGTDGEEVLERARRLGAIPKIHERAELFLNALTSLISDIYVITPPGIMGEATCNKLKISYRSIPAEKFDHHLELYETNKSDTQVAIEQFIQEKVSIIVFFGGDGTARDILKIIGQQIPCLGIPGGVKVYSSVFAADPKKGAELISRFLQGKAPLVSSEVVDINEQAYRNDELQIRLYGYMSTPHAPMLIQGTKQSSPFTDDEKANQIAIGKTIIDEIQEDNYYIFGPGTTIRTIFELLNLKKTLLGFDIILNNHVVERDVNEKKILEIVTKHDTSLVITPIGHQGFVFGRGNLQITPKVMEKIQKENIHIVCTRSKLDSLPNGCIRTDIRDPEMDANLRGYYRVLIDYNEYRMVKMV